MTGAQLLTMTEGILDGQTIDSDLFYNLLNVAKNRREEKRAWMFLRKLDTSKTASAGNNYSTSKALPTDWRETTKLFVGQDLEYYPVEFEEQHRYRNSSRRYLIDLANSVFYILGTVSIANTIYHYYKKTTDDITSATSPVWPERFHPILAYDVAGYFMAGVDADDHFRLMSPENKAAAFALTNEMEMWDARLQNASRGNSLKVARAEQEVDIGTL